MIDGRKLKELLVKKISLLISKRKNWKVDNNQKLNLEWIGKSNYKTVKDYYITRKEYFLFLFIWLLLRQGQKTR